MNNIKLYTRTDNIPDDKFRRLFEIMEYSFPRTERGDAAFHRAEFSRECFRCMCYEPDGRPAAFINYYEFPHDQLVYVEHFAAARELRGNGVGSSLMNELKARVHTGNIVLEVEPPETDITRRRVAFYQRLGFVMNSGKYFQPPFYGNPEPLPLNLMSVKPIDGVSFKETARIIHQKVYRKQTNGTFVWET